MSRPKSTEVTHIARSVPEWAELVRLSTPVLYREIKAGRLTAFKVGRRTLIAAEDLDDWIAELKARPFVLTDTARATAARHG